MVANNIERIFIEITTYWQWFSYKNINNVIAICPRDEFESYFCFKNMYAEVCVSTSVSSRCLGFNMG